MIAPSAGNQQPWHFIVVDDPKLLASILSDPLYDNIAKPVPLAIVVCGDPSMEKHAGFWPQDCSAATLNILLAAHDRGLGAVWTAAHPLEDRVQALTQLLHLPQGVVPLSVVLLGYPDEALPPEDRFDESRVYSNQWGTR